MRPFNTCQEKSMNVQFVLRYGIAKAAQQLVMLVFLSCSVLSLACGGQSDVHLGTLSVDSGANERIDTPVRYTCRYADIFGTRELRNGQYLLLLEKGGNQSEIVAQWQPDGRFAWEDARETGTLVFILSGRTSKDVTRTFDLVIRSGNAPASSLSAVHTEGEYFSFSDDGRPVLRYNYGIVREQEGQTGPYDRSCYIHPIWTPSGDVITGDFSPEHIHQRGLFMAWRPVRFGEIETDFWGLGEATGRILTDREPLLDEGPVFSQLVIRNKGTVSGETYFKELQQITVYSIPENNFRLFDISVRQTPVNPANPDVKPTSDFSMELQKLYYGGMSFRATSDWLRRDARDVQRALSRGVGFGDMNWLPEDVSLDILTSAGLDRQSGDRQPARWIDYTGPLVDSWGGAAMFDFPGNPRYPTPVRIHPQLPYYSWAFVQDEPYTIHPDNPLELTYRVLVHDGHPDAALNERIAGDLEHPPVVKWLK
jgi:hypothetical protein